MHKLLMKIINLYFSLFLRMTCKRFYSGRCFCVSNGDINMSSRKAHIKAR